MPPIIIPNCVKVECEGTVAGRPWANIFHCQLNAAELDGTKAGNIENSVRTKFYGDFLDSLSTQWTLQNTTVTDISTAVGAQFNYSNTAVGTASNELLSPDTALCVSWRSALRGRSYRGRTYLAGLTEASNTSTGRVEAATLTNINGGATVFLADMTADGNPLVVASRVLETVNIITTGVANNVWDRQRRRNYR